jgi:glucose dehydrogenase
VKDYYRAGGDTWITGTYDPDLDTTYWGVAQAKPWMPASRGNSSLDRALYTSSTLALDPGTGALKWYFQHAPGESLDLDEVYERVLVDVGGEKAVFTIGKPGILWKLDRTNGKYLAHHETVFQNIWDKIDPETGEPHYRADIVAMKKGEWIDACPSTEGGHNWQAMSYNLPARRLIIPLSQSCIAMRALERSASRGRWRRGCGSALLRDAGNERQHRQASGLRHRDAERALVSSAARSVPDGGAVDARRPRVRRRPRSRAQGRRCRDRQDLVADAACDLRAGLPDHVQCRRPSVSRGADRRRRRKPASGAVADRA